MATAKHKQGDTFDLSGTVTLSDTTSAITDFSDWTPTSQIRDKAGVLVADLTCEWLDPLSGLIRVHFVGSTGAWPTGTHKMDIQLTSNTGVIVSTETAMIQIIEDITG